MPQIVPFSTLGNVEEISTLCHSKNEPIFINKDENIDLAIMNIEVYESLVNGKLYFGKDVLNKLKESVRNK